MGDNSKIDGRVASAMAKQNSDLQDDGKSNGAFGRADNPSNPQATTMTAAGISAFLNKTNNSDTSSHGPSGDANKNKYRGNK